MKELTFKDKGLFDKFLAKESHELSTYNFANIYIWKGLFKVFWSLIEGRICVFFKDSIGCFMYLAPLGGSAKPSVIKKCFELMDGFNASKDISRIENIEKKDLGVFRKLGYSCAPKCAEYLCKSKGLITLTGNKFKSKRAAYNYFVKNYKFESAQFLAKDSKECLKLYEQWMQERRGSCEDPIYRAMLEDGLTCQKISLPNYRRLNLEGIVVRINNKIKGYTLGYRLNKDTFCILFEICDLKIKGISQYIFRQLTFLESGFKYINVMDDSGLENLRRVKLSYHPAKMIPAFIVKRKDA